MSSLVGIDGSGADINTLAMVTEAQPLQPKLLLVKNSGDLANVADGGAQATESWGRRELWRTRDVPDPAVGRHESVVRAELDAIVARATQLMDQAPNSPMLGARLASALLNAGRLEEAADAADKVGTLQLADPSAVYVAAQVLLQTGRRDAADSLLLRISASALPGSQPSLTYSCLAAGLAADRGDFDLALLRLDDVNGSQAHALRGYVLLELSQTQRALHEFRLARNTGRVQTPALLCNIAYAYAVLGSPVKAVKTARQALTVSPGNSLVLRYLTGYLLAIGRFTEAVSTLLSSAGPREELSADLATALASALHHAGDPKAAIQVLRHTAERLRFKNSDALERAELEANATVLEFYLRRISRSQRLDAIRKLSDVAGGRSIPITCMLADVIGGRSGRAEVMRRYEYLRTIYSDKQLLPLTTRLASLAGDFVEQLRFVREWTRIFPLDLDALTAEVHLLCEFQDYGTAASVGLKSLARFPNALMLRNNTAYALAMAGEVERASRVLKPISTSIAHAIATAGLIELRRGRIREGLKLYRDAAEAVKKEAPDAGYAAQHVAQLAYHLRLVLSELKLDQSPQIREQAMTLPKLTSDWLGDPTFMALARRASRLSLQWPPEEQ